MNRAISPPHRSEAETGRPAIQLGQLRLYNFRNYTDQTISPDPGLNLFLGANAQGKSNLLEAVATIALGRSPRASSLLETLAWGGSEMGVTGTVAKAGRTFSLSVRIHSEAGSLSRRYLLNDTPCAARELLGRCPVVMFWPEDLLVVKAGPEVRRRFLDMIGSQTGPGYATDLLRYRRVTEQRNHLLRLLRQGREDPALLDAFDQQLAPLGARVMMQRGRILEHLQDIAAGAMARLSGGRDDLRVTYRPNVAVPLHDAEQAAAGLHQILLQHRPEELAAGSTLTGPHRDDFAILVNDHPARLYASQGQQRTAALALKMAEVDYFKSLELAPVLLLDDVFSELDSSRHRQLVEYLNECGSQALVTGAGEGLAGLRAGRSWRIEQGTIHDA